jgi:hypothetical protein
MEENESPFITPPIVVEAFPAPAASTPSRIAIGIPVTEKGKPDWSRVSDKVKKKFKDLLADPATQAEFLRVQGESLIDPQSALMMGKMMIGAIFQMQMLAAAIRLKLTKEELQECFQPNFQIFPNFDFDQVITRVIQKRGPDWLAAFADEITLGSVLVLSSLTCWGKAGDIADKKKIKTEIKQENKTATNEPVYVESSTVFEKVGTA